MGKADLGTVKEIHSWSEHCQWILARDRLIRESRPINWCKNLWSAGGKENGNWFQKPETFAWLAQTLISEQEEDNSTNLNHLKSSKTSWNPAICAVVVKSRAMQWWQAKGQISAELEDQQVLWYLELPHWDDGLTCSSDSVLLPKEGKQCESRILLLAIVAKEGSTSPTYLNQSCPD